VLNFVFCIDDNYNLQTSSCILSLLNNVDEKINIYIIHSSKIDSTFLSQEIISNKNLNIIKVFKFDKKFNNFPNVEGKHVSEATYYRLFLEDYINPNISNMEFIIYLDGDIICLDNPVKELRKTISTMKKENFCISANIETIRSEVSEHRFNSLGIKSNTYFNAGVMIINLKNWCSLDIKRKAIEIINSRSEVLELWDQDILNICFENDFHTLDPILNYRFDILKPEKNTLNFIEENVKFLHYYGSTKPWSVKGIIYGYSNHYQVIYRKLGVSFYHITHKWKRLSVVVVIKSIFDLKLFKVQNYFRFLNDVVKSLIK